MFLFAKYKSLLNEYLKLIPPLIISIAIGYAGISLSDTIMVGRIGSKFLAAASMSNGLCSIFFIFSIGIGVALTPIFSSIYITNDVAKNTKILKHGIILNAFLGIILYLIIFLLSKNLHLLNQAPEVTELSTSYLQIVSLSIIPRSIKDILNRYLEGIGLAKISMIGSMITFFNNIILNYVLIFGKFGFPELKLFGAGLATFLARVLDLLFLYLYFKIYLKKKKLIHNFYKVNFSISKFVYLFKICFPSALQLTFETGFFAFETVIIGWLGVKFQAANAIASNILRISFVFPLSIAIATSILVGKNLGLKNYKNIKNLGIISYSMIIVYYIINSFFLIIFYEDILHIYKSEYIVKQIFSSFLYFLLLFQFFEGINVIGVNLLRGIKDTFIPVVYTTTAQWIFGIPLSLIVFKTYGTINAIWSVSALVFFISSLSLIFRFYFKIKMLLKK